MSIGERIKLLRIKQGLSIDDLANKLGKNRTTIYRYENGDIENLPLDILDPLADALNTTPAHIIGWIDKDVAATRLSNNGEEAFYYSINESYVKHVEMWHEEFGMDPFTEAEHKKLMEYGRFLLSLRKK